VNWHETEGHSSETEGLLKQLLQRPDRAPPATPPKPPEDKAAKAVEEVPLQLGDLDDPNCLLQIFGIG
jgi:hypothetical protein